MNCANHPDTPAVAYCRTCGKPLCANCTRSVQGVIYCETCLADRLHGTQPPVTPPPNAAAGFTSTQVPPIPGTPPSNAPNPALAGVLSIFPGVGSVYTGQYTKGLAYMGIFILLILGIIHVSWVFALILGFFVVYQFIDAIQTAKALQAGQPVPDPLGMAQIFSPGQKVDTSKIPIGAVVLIALGVIFLLSTVMDFDIGDLWPLILIGLGLWLGATRMGLTGKCAPTTPNPRTLMGPAILLTLGSLFLLERMHGPGFHRTWPVLLLVIGLIKLMGSNQPNAGMQPPMPPPASPTSGPIEGEVQPPSNEVRNG
jgi:hypothetical protein